MHKYIGSIIFIIILFSSCSKNWLEAKTDKSLVIPATLADFQGILDNLSVITQNSPVSGELASDGHYVTDAVYQNRTKGYQTNTYIWSDVEPTVKVANGANWGQPYQRVLDCNIVLDGLDKLTPANTKEQELLNNIKGQALFQRARTFFEFALIYASPYDEATAAKDPGVVMRLSSDITLPSKRSTVKETYDQILHDLTVAKDLMPDRPAILTRASKSAALAFLARIYLSMETYDKAFSFADQALQIYSALLDYNDISPTATYIGRYNPEVIFHANYVDNFLTSNCLVEQDQYNLYHSNDLRKTRLFRVTGSNITFKGNYENTTSNLFCGLATDELYLIRAECYARDGKVQEAMKELNDLVRMRWDKHAVYPVITATDQEDALKKVLLERRKELFLRSIRWSDLRRLNRDSRFVVTLKRIVLGTEYTLVPNSYQYTLPIPDFVIQQTGIAQNKDWDE